MTCTAFLQRWKLLTLFILLSSTPSYVECSYSVRDDECCEETSCNICSRPPVCTVNHSSRCGLTRRCSDLEVRGRLPRPSAWLLVALLSALAGATACWIANLLAPPPGTRRKTSKVHSSQLPAKMSQYQQRREQQKRTDVLGDQQHVTT